MAASHLSNGVHEIIQGIRMVREAWTYSKRREQSPTSRTNLLEFAQLIERQTPESEIWATGSLNEADLLRCVN